MSNYNILRPISQDINKFFDEQSEHYDNLQYMCNYDIITQWLSQPEVKSIEAKK